MLGYAGLNRTLRERDPPVRANRSMRKKTWESRGLSYASELAVQNFEGLLRILRWNAANDVRFYRCSSKLVPWNSQFALEDLPDYAEIRRLAERCGDLLDREGMRLTFHPDYWCKLASTSADTRDRAKRAVEYHADWLDLLGRDRSAHAAINVHIGATYGDRAATADRFRAAVRDLSPGARARLTVENDDDPNAWGVTELADVVEPLDVPVVFDYHHHSFTDRGRSYREGFARAAETWDVRPIAHYSEPASLRDPSQKPQAHARFVADLPDWLRDAADVMIEADGKERAVRRARGEA
ncbi:MAG: UV DNA damage repair endonuclease UvsE [Halobaculum sp.]